jgi:hypothetical protein
MKKAAVIAIIVTLIFSSAAGAYPVSVGDTIYITSSGPLGGGGEIAVVNQSNGFKFESFCLERQEIILQGSKNPYVVYDLSPYAMSGGGGAVDGKDELSGATKWLYYNYWTGALASEYGYNGVGSKKGQGALQLAIWYLEGETDLLVEKDGGGKKWDGRDFYDLAMQHEKEGAFLPVYAMNIWGPYRAGAESGEGQSMLVVTPEPWTLMLLGAGLVVLAGLRRGL